MSSIVIFGASGLTGSHLLKHAINDNDIDKITIFSRKQIAITHPKLINRVIDFADLHRYQADLDCDSVYCCLGTTIKKAGNKDNFRQIDVLLIEQIAVLAKQAQAKQFIVISSQGADVKSKFFYNRCKGEMENRLVYLFKNSDCQLIICQPSLLIGKRHEHRFAEDLAIKLNRYLPWLWRGKLAHYQPILATDLASAMLTLAKACNVKCMVVANRNLHNVIKTKALNANLSG